MAVVAVRPIDSTLRITGDRERVYTVTYEVESNNPTGDGPKTIASASSLPSPGTTYSYGDETDTDALCIGAAGDIQYRDLSTSRRIWVVPVLFATEGVTGGSGSDGQSNPQQIDGPWVVSGDTATRMFAKLVDQFDTPLCNSAGERFVPAPETPLTMGVIRLGRKTSSLDFVTWLTTVNAINSTQFWGQPAYTWKCTKWAWSVQWRGGNAFIQNDVELQYDAKTWVLKPYDYGKRYIDPLDRENPDGSTKYKDFKNEGELSAEGQFLNGMGGRLPAGGTPVLLDGNGGRNGPFFMNGTTDFNSVFPAVIPGPITGY